MHALSAALTACTDCLVLAGGQHIILLVRLVVTAARYVAGLPETWLLFHLGSCLCLFVSSQLL